MAGKEGMRSKGERGRKGGNREGEGHLGSEEEGRRKGGREGGGEGDDTTTRPQCQTKGEEEDDDDHIRPALRDVT